MGEDYVALFLNSSLAAERPEAFLSLMFLGLARLLPIIAMSPFFGARILPHPVKVTFALSLFLIFLPKMLAVTTRPVFFSLDLVFLVSKEMFIGFSMGWLMSTPFSIVQNVGMILDHQRGGASLMVNDPTIQNQSSPLGTLFNFFLIYLFFMIDGPFQYMEAIITSYEVVPPDQMLPVHFFSKTSTFWETQFKLFNKVMVLSIQLAAPGLIAILMTDFFLGIANRLAPQIQITFLGMPLKSLLALLVVCIGWQLFAKELVKQLYSWLQLLNLVLQSIGLQQPP